MLQIYILALTERANLLCASTSSSNSVAYSVSARYVVINTLFVLGT
jgi:hypothetical protein